MLYKKHDEALENKTPTYPEAINVYQEIGHIKYIAFTRCLTVGHNNSDLTRDFLWQDCTNLEFPGYEVVNRFEPLIQATYEKIKLDSIYLSDNWMTNPDYKNTNRKRVLALCLEMFQSEELDSLTKSI
jgi:uncharacterized membrane-anchored protein